MSATQILDSLTGEGLIGIEPPLLQQPGAGWLERLSLFTGRTLSDSALTQEQKYRSGRFTLLGQAVTQGVVQGLDLSIDLTAADPVISVAPGYGISATGQDVTLLRAMKTTLRSVAVVNGDTGAPVTDLFSGYPPASLQQTAGILLLRSLLAAVPGSEVDSGESNIVVSGNLDASCDQDPAENAFGDQQIVDATQLVFVTWPSSVTVAPFAPSANWRNRLVYTVFEAELGLAIDDRLPWEFLGVPLGIVAFGGDSKPLFVDRFSIVRAGGLPRRRYLKPLQNGNTLALQPALVNARVSQLAEQLGADLTPSSPASLIPNEFAFLPPTGILPAYTMDFPNRTALWCPSSWSITAAPVYAEELEGIIQGGITADRLNTAQPESIEILVPLPDEVYDPNILVTEVVASVFQQEVNAATLARNAVLRHRKAIELEANALSSISNQPQIDIGAGLTADEIAARDGSPVYAPLAAETFATASNGNAGYISTDLQNLQKFANAAPYTVTVGTTSIGLFSASELAGIAANGLQHFIDCINAKLNKANDLLDLAFLTEQTDIYRYRQNVLQTSDATRLAVSPILANIASGVTAAATATNISTYLESLKPATQTGVVLTKAAATSTTDAPAATVKLNRAQDLSINRFVSPVAVRSIVPTTAAKNLTAEGSAVNKATIAPQAVFTGAFNLNRAALTAQSVSIPPPATPIVNQVASTRDITEQSPIVGAALNLRTLTIAERLTPPASQEALFYSVANRVAFLQLLADLEITVDDLPILVDNVPTTITTPFTVSDLRSTADATRNATLFTLVNNPQIDTPISTTNPDEGKMFSVGIHVLEQHTQLMRGIEGRIQTYRDFLTVCSNALSNVQANLQPALSLITQLNNDLTQMRQNLAFVLTLLADETARVAGVNATRTKVLNTYVKYIAYTRPRTLVNQPGVPSRQLVPADVASPVPACLNQVLVVPPELREMVALLREAPVKWFPPILSYLSDLERPALLQELAFDTQARASMVLNQPLHVSSAAYSTGVFAPSIASRYSAGQQVFRSYQAQRAGFQPASIASQSWASQINLLGDTVSVADLQNSAAVHAEVAAAAARTQQQISNVATCLYTRVGQALPIDRLVWAQYLQANASVSVRSLAVLPGWNSQSSIDRQQMQLLVDWLFQQVSTTDTNSLALMNDVVAVAILLASDSPVDGIIAGAVATRTTPIIGNPIRLTLPSDRVAHGMYVNLYSAGSLAARGVVSDLDGFGATATITDIYQPNVTLQASDIANFTIQNRDAVVYKAFS